ncbi:MAG: aldo/keto reductase [Deltaproteobacteria bacterium]|nr:aldo/keto reductase [Deltaproteobacteria bacterium]
MKQVPLGETGLMVSEVGFGGIPITRITVDEGVALVRAALDKGITYFDTARMYGDSEVKMGRALEGRRDQVVVATKTMKRSAEEMTQEIEASLEALRTTWIDLYQIHNLAKPEDLQTVLAPGGAYEALTKAQAQGKVKHIGFSSHHPDTAIQAIETGRFATVQFACNFVEDQAAGKVFAAAKARGMACIAMKPLGGGLLERADLCFAWLQAQEGVLPIPGMQSTSELNEIAGLYEQRRELNQADLDEMQRIRDELGTRFCHRCGYCMPCPNGINIPKVMLFTSQSRRFPPQHLIKASKDFILHAEENCEDCGECSERCPYELPIPEMLGEITAAFRDFMAQHGQA